MNAWPMKPHEKLAYGEDQNKFEKYQRTLGLLKKLLIFMT